MQVFRVGGKVLCLGLWSKRFRGWRFKRGPFSTWELALGIIRIQWQLSRWL